MRARLPDREGFITRDGVRVAFEIFGHGDLTLLLIPATPNAETVAATPGPSISSPYRLHHAFIGGDLASRQLSTPTGV